LDNQRVAQRKRRRGWRFNLIVAVSSLVAVFLLIILVDAAIYHGKVHTGVSIAGQSVGGLTTDQAIADVSERVDETQQSAIILTADSKNWKIMPDEVGTKMDVAGAVAEAMDVSRKGNFLADLGKRIKLYFTDVDIPLVGTVDTAKLDQVLAGIAQELNVAPVNAGLTLEDNKIKVIEDKQGLEVDVDSLREQLKTTLLSRHATELQVPVVIIEPEVKAEDTQEAVDRAETMIGSPIVLTFEDQKWTITPDQITSFMDFASEDHSGVSTLMPYLSGDKMGSFFDSIADKVVKEPVNATFKSDGEKAWVVPGILGTALDRVKTAELINTLSQKGTGRTAEVAVTTTDPELTTEEAEARGIKDKLASYTTEWVGTKDRQTNVRITTEYASNVMLAPGEVYNFDKQIGPRTAARGYKTAPGIVGPGKLEDVFGGGICQVSTTLFNTVFFAGLEVVERKNHSIYIDHYPKGRDATVSAGGPNLRFRNDTSHYIWIRGSSNGVTTTFTIYGTSEGRKVTYTTSDFYNVVARTEVTIPTKELGPGTSVVKIGGQSGKQITVVRTVKLPDGTVVHTDKFVSTFPMVPRQIEVGTGTTTTTIPSTTSTTKPPTSTTNPPTTVTTDF